MVADKINYAIGGHGGGINTVFLNGEYVHITDLDDDALCTVWAERQRTLNDLYEVNKQANEGWRGAVLRLIGIRLPERPTRFGFMRKVSGQEQT
ncbi:hypothetical protein [Pseudomonas syringae pv. coryli]|uniref:hypothetical protein n=1 Tax=Pseudomonas syringae pv. coryli TaxID=317659 RepID=UPI003D275617